MEQLKDGLHSEAGNRLKDHKHKLGPHEAEGFPGDQKKPVFAQVSL